MCIDFRQILQNISSTQGIFNTNKNGDYEYS